VTPTQKICQIGDTEEEAGISSSGHPMACQANPLFWPMSLEKVQFVAQIAQLAAC
jgi:hypothetical protein